MASSNNRDVARRTWDVDAFAQRARERERAEKEAENEKLRARKASQHRDHIDGDPFAPTRAWLTKRDHEIDFEAKVGSSEIVSSIQGGGFHCKLCDVMSKDSNRYLSHMNSKAHQKMLGMSLRVRRSTVEEVEEAFARAVRKRDAKKVEAASSPLTVKERIRKRKEEARKAKLAEQE